MGRKKDIWICQLIKDIYSLHQGKLYISEYYGILKSKWKDVDYEDTWESTHNQITR